MPENPTIFTPTDILNIVKEHLKTTNTPVVIEGLYQRVGTKAYNGGLIWYDEIKSVYDNSKLKAIVPTGIRDQINHGDLVQLSGTIGKSLNDYTGQIELQLRVSGLEGKKENVLTDEEKERLDLIQKKAAKGSRSVDTKLEAILYGDERKPKVALVYAEASITDEDFRAGVQAASGRIDFEEVRQSFGNAEGFRQMMKDLDRSEAYDIICVIRGGGSGLDVFDKPPMVSVLLEMITPVITAIGHEADTPLICKLSDRNIGTPSLLGQYFKDMVESVNEKKTRSHAALTEKIKKQFQQQLEAGQKQNEELQKRLTALTKTQEESQKQHKEQVEKSNKQNEDLQKKLTTLTDQLKRQSDQSQKQQTEFNSNLKQMQNTNAQITRQLDAAKNNVTQLERQLAYARRHDGSGWKAAAIIAIFIALVCLIVAVVK